MKLKQIASNMTVLEISDGIGYYNVLFSYSTPVAMWSSGGGYVKTDKFWSKTTSRHINKWLRECGGIQDPKRTPEVPQWILDNLVNDISVPQV